MSIWPFVALAIFLGWSFPILELIDKVVNNQVFTSIFYMLGNVDCFIAKEVSNLHERCDSKEDW